MGENRHRRTYRNEGGSPMILFQKFKPGDFIREKWTYAEEVWIVTNNIDNLSLWHSDKYNIRLIKGGKYTCIKEGEIRPEEKEWIDRAFRLVTPEEKVGLL